MVISLLPTSKKIEVRGKSPPSPIKRGDYMVKAKGYGVTVESQLEDILVKEGRRIESQRLVEKALCKMKCNVKHPLYQFCRAFKHYGCSVIRRK